MIILVGRVQWLGNADANLPSFIATNGAIALVSVFGFPIAGSCSLAGTVLSWKSRDSRHALPAIAGLILGVCGLVVALTYFVWQLRYWMEIF